MLFAGKTDQVKQQDSERKTFHVFSHLQILYVILKHKLYICIYIYIYIFSTKKVFSSIYCSLTKVTPMLSCLSPTLSHCWRIQNEIQHHVQLMHTDVKQKCVLGMC